MQYRTATCERCGLPRGEGGFCANCKVLNADPGAGLYAASGSRRLAGRLLDLTLFVVCLGVGWWIWLGVTSGGGQSPAKRMLGLRVVRADGSAMGGGGVWFRDGVLALLLTPLLPLSALWALRSASRQTLHDVLVGSAVVSAEARPATGYARRQPDGMTSRRPAVVLPPVARPVARAGAGAVSGAGAAGTGGRCADGAGVAAGVAGAGAIERAGASPRSAARRPPDVAGRGATVATAGAGLDIGAAAAAAAGVATGPRGGDAAAAARSSCAAPGGRPVGPDRVLAPRHDDDGEDRGAGAALPRRRAEPRGLRERAAAADRRVVSDATAARRRGARIRSRRRAACSRGRPCRRECA